MPHPVLPSRCRTVLQQVVVKLAPNVRQRTEGRAEAGDTVIHGNKHGALSMSRGEDQAVKLAAKRTKLAVFAVALLVCAGASNAATPEAKALYEQTRAAAATEYKAARDRCNGIAGNPKDVCIAEAQAARVRAEADATAHYRNTLRAYTKARIDIANADFALDRTRCAALEGNERDVCVERAKASRTAALA